MGGRQQFFSLPWRENAVRLLLRYLPGRPGEEKALRKSSPHSQSPFPFPSFPFLSCIKARRRRSSTYPEPATPDRRRHFARANIAGARHIPPTTMRGRGRKSRGKGKGKGKAGKGEKRKKNILPGELESRGKDNGEPPH